MKPEPLPFAEMDFYLDEFHSKTLLFVGSAAALLRSEAVEEFGKVGRALLQNETRVAVLLGSPATRDEQRCLASLRRCLSVGNRSKFPPPVELSATGSEEALLAQIWSVLRISPLFIGVWPTDSEAALLACAQRIASRLKVYKLVLLNAEGGIDVEGSAFSFMNGSVLGELLRQGEAEWSGLGRQRPLLEAIRAVLDAGVTSVSLCSVPGLARELFTYEGCGTFFTLADYCRVERLGIDDFHEVEKLIERGEHEGYLKPRSRAEIDYLLLHGYGARLGAASGELAGFCALLPYLEARTAEIAGLYTISRFQGEGIGGRLVTTMLEEGKRRRMTYLFAVTTQEGAQRLFERYGFRRVRAEDVAEAKWHGYDAERKKSAAVYRRELSSEE